MKQLKSICDILSLERKGSKEEAANRILKFLMEPDESLCMEASAEDEEMDEDDFAEEEEEEEDEPSEDEKRKSKTSGGRSGGRSSGRPRRSTAGKSRFSLAFHSIIFIN